MVLGGEKTALDLAVAEYRQRQLRDATQLELFGEPVEAGAEAAAEAAEGSAATGTEVEVERRGGRPVGARNKRTDEAARIYMAQFGDPLRRGVHISALPILAPGVLEGLARALGCDRHDAAKWWAGIYAATMPYIHTKNASLTIRPEGAPDGEPADLDWALTPSGELIDVTPNSADNDDEAERASAAA